MVLPALVLVTAALAAVRCAARELAPARRAWRVWLALAALTALALAVRATLSTSRHVMYVDECWYLEAARSIAARLRAETCELTWAGLRCAPYRKALGWPLLLALAGARGPDADQRAIELSTLLGALCAPATALVARAARAAWPAAVGAGVVAACHPLLVTWSTTGETHAAGALALLATAAFALRWSDAGAPHAAVGALAAAVWSAALRPEQGVVFAGLAALFAWRRAYALVAVTALAAAATWPALAPMWSLNAQMSGGAFFAPERVTETARALASSEWRDLHVTVGLAALAGLAGWPRRAMATTVALALPLAVALACFARFQERMLVGVVALLIPAVSGLRAPGAPWAWAVAVALLDAQSLDGLRGWRSPDPQRLETRFAGVVARTLPRGAWLVAERPEVYAATSASPVMRGDVARAGGVSALLAEASRRPVFVACDMYCEPAYRDADGGCARLLAGLSVEAVATTRRFDRRYQLLRVRGPRRAGDASPACLDVAP